MDKAAKDALADLDAARIGLHVTCGASRHAAMIAEALVKGEPYAMLTEDPRYCGESIAAVVAALWKARAELSAQGHQAEAVAWLHVMHYEEGCGRNEKLTFEAQHPFGLAGADFSKEYRITSAPLFARPAAQAD